MRGISMFFGAVLLVGGAATASAQDGGGKPPERVLGGAAASIEEFPWQVALITDGASPSEGQFCGGSVVAPSWVLTAAHCAADRSAAEVAVYWGSASLEGGGYLADAARLVAHPGYAASGGNDDDIALIELAAPISALPVRLADPAWDAAFEAEGRLAVVTGWGEQHPLFDADAPGAGDLAATVAALTDRYPTELQSATLPIVNLDICEAALSDYNADLDQREICAGAIREGKDACNGDSGGPLQVRDADGRYVQIGLVSWGKPCSAGGYYNVYTRVSAYRDWIWDTINGVETGEPAASEEPASVVATPDPAAHYGRITLAAGFANDPAALDLSAGGTQAASSLGAGCVGYIASIPDVILGYTAGTYALHVSVGSDKDTTLVVLGPDGRFSCADDVEGSNPSIAIASPTSGDYRIWVGAYDEPELFAYPQATLFISELGPRYAR